MKSNQQQKSHGQRQFHPVHKNEQPSSLHAVLLSGLFHCCFHTLQSPPEHQLKCPLPCRLFQSHHCQVYTQSHNDYLVLFLLLIRIPWFTKSFLFYSYCTLFFCFAPGSFESESLSFPFRVCT